MIHRIHGRDPFRRLARDGRRIRRPALWCSWCPDPLSTTSTTTSVAFALSRALGPAVVRNRLRRRLRAACRMLDRAGSMPGGLLLIGANPAVLELSFAQIESEMASLMAELTMTPRDPTPRDPTPRDPTTRDPAGTAATTIVTGPVARPPAGEPSA